MTTLPGSEPTGIVALTLGEVAPVVRKDRAPVVNVGNPFFTKWGCF